MPAIIRSSFGFDDTLVMLPHSDAIPARLEVTFTQFPGEGKFRGGLAVGLELGLEPGSGFGLGFGFGAKVEEVALVAVWAARRPLQPVCISSEIAKQNAIRRTAFISLNPFLVARRIYDSAGAGQINVDRW
jgi:hypothetical protein